MDVEKESFSKKDNTIEYGVINFKHADTSYAYNLV